MEFADLGAHCSLKSCHQLDFLPINCSACNKPFCKVHASFEGHNCPEQKQAVVLECPLCSCKIPCLIGQDPDRLMTRHIEKGCEKDKARRKLKRFTCTAKGCHKKEMEQVLCGRCKKQFCLRHRFHLDHDCTGPEPEKTWPLKPKKKPISTSAAASSKPKESAKTSHNDSRPSSTCRQDVLKETAARRKMQSKSTAKAGGGKAHSASSSSSWWW